MQGTHVDTDNAGGNMSNVQKGTPTKERKRAAKDQDVPSTPQKEKKDQAAGARYPRVLTDPKG